MYYLIKIFRKPIESSSDVNHTAIYLHTILIYSLLATIVIIPISFFSQRPIATIVSGIIILIIFINLNLLYWGRLTAASYITLILFTLAAVFTAYMGDGINDISILIFPGILVIAAMLLNNRIYILFTAITTIMLALIPLMRALSGLPNIYHEELPAEIVTALAILIATAAGIRVLYVRLIESLSRSKINEERYRNIFENIQDVYFEMKEDGTILEISPGIKNLLGYNRTVMLSQRLQNFYTDPGQHSKFITSLQKNGWIEDFEVLINDQKVKQHTISINARYKTGDAKYNIVGSIRDQTDKKVLEAQLVQSQKLDSIGRMAGGIAHDFNNLLTIINGHCQLALEKIKVAKNRIEEDLQAIHAAGKKAAALTRQMLAFSRKQIYNPQVINPNLIITELERMFRRMIGENINIELALGKSVGTHIKADPSQLEQITINLLINARDALQEKKTGNEQKNIIIESNIRCVTTGEAAGHTGSLPGDFYVLSVSDNGIGMKPEVRNNIFEPFYTTKATGTGLGLSMVYGIVKQNRGFITVYSEENEGTTFKVYWPLTDEKKRVPDIQTPGENLHGNETILLVEDDERVRNYIKQSLEKYGHKVLSADNGQSASEVFEKHQQEIQLLLTDLIMPGISGTELAAEIKRTRPDLSILYISGYTDNYITYNEILDSDVNYLQKPFSVVELMRKIRELLDPSEK